MAVYTHLGAERLARLIGHYDVGTLVSAKGIAEGVSNSNWLIETTGAGGGGTRFILTMYEKRIDTAELPFFLGLLDHLAARRCPVPRTIHDRQGAASRTIDGKAVALIEYLPGVSVDRPTAAQARAVGGALAQLHLASADYPAERSNALGPESWATMVRDCGGKDLASIDPALPDVIKTEMAQIAAHWPGNLPRSIIHADLFPDNVLMLGNQVSGMIDFYFACTDLTAYDLAVTHAAWCFDRTGRTFDVEVSRALIEGYEALRPLHADERAALPVLARGAALRFALTRAVDWLNPEGEALVTPKDPLDFVRRLAFYAQTGPAAFT